MKKLILIAAAAATLTGFASTASAKAPNGNSPSFVYSTVGELRTRGFYCRYMRGAYICSRFGEAWVCDGLSSSSRCEKAKKAPPRPHRPKAPVQGPVLRLH